MWFKENAHQYSFGREEAAFKEKFIFIFVIQEGAVPVDSLEVVLIASDIPRKWNSNMRYCVIY